MRRDGSMGTQAEAWAMALVVAHGYTVLAQQYSCRYGELDLVLLRDDVLVFVEVKYRKSQSFGGVLEAITANKMVKMSKAAACFLQAYPQYAQHNCRMDAILFEKNQHGVSWIEDASSLTW